MLIRLLTTRLLALTILTGGIATTIGCNTMEGVGEDTKAAGEKIDEAAEDAKD